MFSNQPEVVSVSSCQRVYSELARGMLIARPPSSTSASSPQCQISVPLIKVIPRFNLCVILRRNNDTRTHNQNQFRNRRVLINSIFRTVPLTFIHRNNSQRYLIDWGRASSARTLWNCRAPPRNKSYYSQNEELCIIDIWPGL